MKPIKIETEMFSFQLDSYGMFRLDEKNPKCPEESGFTGIINNQEDRVALARFLGDVSMALATPKASKPIMHNPKFNFRLND